jgi:ATP-dependent Lon protease
MRLISWAKISGATLVRHCWKFWTRSKTTRFYDNYLELEFDLSKVLSIATANSLSEIQPALRDRLEIIQLSGYSPEEKIEIAKRHLIPKQKELHGLGKVPLKFPDKVILQYHTGVYP